MATTLFINFVNVAATFVDFLFFPINYLIYKPPWKFWRKQRKLQHHELIFGADCTDVLYKPALPEPTCKNKEAMINENIDTMDKIFDYMVKRYAQKACLGHRKVLGTKKHLNEEGKVLNKVLLEDRYGKNIEKNIFEIF